MSNIDFSKAITAEQKAEADAVAAKEAAKAECARRIAAEFSPATQINLASAKAMGSLTAKQEADYKSALAWVKKMREVWPKIKDPEDDASWPVPTKAASKLMGDF